MDRILYHAPAMGNLAQRICQLTHTIQLGKIDWNRFDDGWPNFFVHQKDLLRRRDVIFLAAFERPADVFEQVSVINALPRFEARSLKVILPDFPTGTMERLDAAEDGSEEGKIATAKTLARILSDIPMSAVGPTPIVIYDIHALQEKFYFGDQVIARLVSAMPLLGRMFPNPSAIDIVFPDEGAEKRFGRIFGAYAKILCSKTRSGDQRKVRIESGDPQGRHVVIVDDRALSGGTILAAKKELLSHGAAKVSVFVTHGVFPNRSWERFLDAGFEKVWITNSCPTTAAAVDREGPFEIVSLAESIVQEIMS